MCIRRNPSSSWRLLLQEGGDQIRLQNNASQSKPKPEATPTIIFAILGVGTLSQSKPKLEATPTEQCGLHYQHSLCRNPSLSWRLLLLPFGMSFWLLLLSQSKPKLEATPTEQCGLHYQHSLCRNPSLSWRLLLLNNFLTENENTIVAIQA